jgi:hypothetical protein
MTSTQWGVFPLFKASPSWRIRLGGQSIRIDEDVIELIRKDPLHLWGWYDGEIAQAWTEIASAVQEEDPPLLTDMVWLQDISPYWNFLTDIPRIDGIHCPQRVRCQPLRELRFVQFSGGGVLRNIAGIRREEGDVINPNPLQLARKSEFSQVSSDCEMRAPVQSLDPLLRVEGDGVPRVPVYLDSDSE